MSLHKTRKVREIATRHPDKILIIDTETTGLRATSDEILQITILDGSGRTLFDSYIKPTHHKTWKSAEKVNGISPETVKDAPAFSEVRSKVQKCFNNARIIVGYNVNFDINFLRAAGVLISGSTYDVMTEFAQFRANHDKTLYRRCKLTECAEYFDHSFNPHNSSEDARATLYCFNQLKDHSYFDSKSKRSHSQKTSPVTESTPSHRKTSSFTIQHRTWKKINLAWPGLCIFLAGQILLFQQNHIICSSLDYYFILVMDIINRREILSLVDISVFCIGIGVIFILIGIAQVICRFPRWISHKIMHCIHKFI